MVHSGPRSTGPSQATVRPFETQASIASTPSADELPTHRDPWTDRQRLVGEHLRHVEHLRHGLHADDTGLPEQRVHRARRGC